MTDVTSPAATIGALARYLAQWLRGLRSASAKRQADCIGAINAVISGARRTQAYARQRDTSRTDVKTEADLAAMWTDLGHQLEALGVKKLAKRCDVNGRYWAAPERFSKEWLADADVGLEAVERLARRLKAHIQAHGAP